MFLQSEAHCFTHAYPPAGQQGIDANVFKVSSKQKGKFSEHAGPLPLAEETQSCTAFTLIEHKQLDERLKMGGCALVKQMYGEPENLILRMQCGHT